MASISQDAILRSANRLAGVPEFLERYFYFAMSLLIAVTVVWGFSRTIDMNLFHAAVPRPFILWAHGAAFSLWIVFFVLQSALVRTRNVRLHRSLGWFGAALAACMVFLGVTTAIIMGRFDMSVLHQPQAGTEAFLIVPFSDMLVFGTSIALAVLWRRRLELHRPLMFFATCVLLDAAFGRFEYLFNTGLFYACLDAVIFLGVVRDLLVKRRVNEVYRFGLPVLIVIQLFVNYTWHAGPSWWIRIAHRILG
jgi:hypothetical protein